MKTSHAHFRRFQSPTFVCQTCDRRTRDTGQGVDHLCEDCYEIAGIDNSINDNGIEPGTPDFEQYVSELTRRLKHIAKLGGNVNSVLRQNDFCFSSEAVNHHFPDFANVRDENLAPSNP